MPKRKPLGPIKRGRLDKSAALLHTTHRAYGATELAMWMRRYGFKQYAGYSLPQLDKLAKGVVEFRDYTSRVQRDNFHQGESARLERAFSLMSHDGQLILEIVVEPDAPINVANASFVSMVLTAPTRFYAISSVQTYRHELSIADKYASHGRYGSPCHKRCRVGCVSQELVKCSGLEHILTAGAPVTEVRRALMWLWNEAICAGVKGMWEINHSKPQPLPL